MRTEYEQTPNEERKLWRDKLQQSFINISNQQNQSNLIEKSVKFIRSEYTSTMTPKSILIEYAIQADIDKPVYHTEELRPQRVFRTIIDFNGKQYSTTSWEKNKQLAEQGSAIACLLSIGIDPNKAKYGVQYLKNCISSKKHQ